MAKTAEEAPSAPLDEEADPLDRACPYACVDGTHLKKSWGGACESVAALIAMGVSTD